MYRIVSEYETFKATALKVPEESREMMSLMDYMEQARTTLVVNLQRDVDVRRWREGGREEGRVCSNVCK